MRLTGFILFLVLFSVLAYGQDIVNDLEYKEGIYLSFEEFKTNSPSLTCDFYFSTKKNGVNFELILTDTVVGKKFLKEKIWGVCTGEVIYVNTSNYQNSKGFTRLGEIGRYCVFKDQVSINRKNDGSLGGMALVGGLVGGVIGHTIVGSIPTETALVLNMNNGNCYFLRKETVELILQSEPQLLESFQKESRKSDEDVMVEYISKYNALNKDEYISPTEPSYIPLVIYRRDKRESEYPVSVYVNDSLITKLSINDYLEVEIEERDEMIICANKKCADFSLESHTANYLECGDGVKSGAFIEKVSSKHGAFYLNKVKYYKEKQNSSR